MDYLAIWKILEEMIVELRKKGVETPQNVMNDLKSAMILLKIMDASEADPGEAAPRLEMYLGSVEAYIVTEVTEKFEAARVDSWLKRLEEASCSTYVKCIEREENFKKKFIKGVPRDKSWIRVDPLNSLPLEKLEELAEQQKLSSHLEEDGCLLVYGKSENLREFIKRIAEHTTK